MLRNLDLKLKDRGLVGLLVVVALVAVLSLLENLDLFLKEEVFREKDLTVGLGRGVVVVSSELEFLEKVKVRMGVNKWVTGVVMLVIISVRKIEKYRWSALVLY